MVSFLFSKTRQDTCRGHLWGMKSARITIQIIQLLKSHCRRVSSQYWLLGRANRNILAPIIAQWLMSTATISSKSNYSDKVNRMLIWISCKKMDETLSPRVRVPWVRIYLIHLNSWWWFFPETSPVLSIIVASVSFVIIILILVVFILFCRRTKKRLKPADVIPAVSVHSLLLSFKYLSFCQQRENLRMKYAILSFLIKYFSCTWMAHIER